MSKTNLYLAYQKDSGRSLDLIQSLSKYPDVPAYYCDDCGGEVERVDNDELVGYIRWLEEKVEMLLYREEMERTPHSDPV